jgi:hypothetical protein
MDARREALAQLKAAVVAITGALREKHVYAEVAGFKVYIDPIPLGTMDIAIGGNNPDKFVPFIEAAAATLGRNGGASKSKAKTSAARENGKKGGRPKKGTK